MFRLILFCFIGLFTSQNYSQKKVNISALNSSFVLKENRENYRSELDKKIRNVFTNDLNVSTENTWKSLFREVELAYLKNEIIYNAVKKAANYAVNSNPSFQRAVIEIIYSLYPDSLYKPVYKIFQSTDNNQVFSTAAVYLNNHDSKKISSGNIKTELRKRFPNYDDDPVLKLLAEDLSNNTTELSDTMLIDLLSHPFQEGKTIIYSFHRYDRSFPGVTVIKKPDGKFVRNNDSTIFSIPQLARSTSRLPGYISQGDTPQGIYSIVGFYISPTETIGPTPNVLTRIPFEVSTEIFYHNENRNNEWELADYKYLLPDSWKEYLWAYEAFYAGRSGRRLIVMHGSTDDVNFYRDLPYYPLTPTRGCLTSKEIWSEETGNCIESDQVKLMNAFYSTNQLYGFLIVMNLNDKKEPVTPEEIQPYIKASESLNFRVKD